MKRFLPISTVFLYTTVNAIAHGHPHIRSPDSSLDRPTTIPDLIHSILPDLNFDNDIPESESHPPATSNPDTAPTPETIILPPGLGYTLTWHDEFTPRKQSLYSTNNEEDTSQAYLSQKWTILTGTSYPTGAPNWGNNELQSYTTSPANILITSSKTLLITPRHNPQSNTWTSARLETTSTSFSASVGGKLYIESRLRTGCAPANNQKGIWPAFWALGAEFRNDPTFWPMSSEWDFMEVVNGEPVVYHNLHCGGVEHKDAGGGPCNEFTGVVSPGTDWGCGWHVVGFEVDRSGSGSGEDWEEEVLRWFVDGEETWRVSGGQIGDEEIWESIAHQGHFLLLNVAVGGNWPGYPDENTVDGEEVGLEVDYVRVWNAD
ncbi:concanavalin A-like lectin/glucanase domain-containing protein [Aspergillus karnatakaensis]|uniref:glycoside hydrolase family 16 protein n=1 Tax=Aspergillus karnatakaensis TaxID=1810916 RepID=UPI003CCD76CA